MDKAFTVLLVCPSPEMVLKFIIPRCFSCWVLVYMALTPGEGATTLLLLVSQLH